MEEKKKAQSKTTSQGMVEEKKKLTYEELENIANQLSNQAKTMYEQLQKANLENMFHRLDFLFRVVENSLKFNDDFVEKCVNEISGLLTIPEKGETEDLESTEEN